MNKCDSHDDSWQFVFIRHIHVCTKGMRNVRNNKMNDEGKIRAKQNLSIIKLYFFHQTKYHFDSIC